MNEDNLKELLVRISKGEVSVDEGIDRLKDLPYEDIGVAHIDHHRSLRRGMPEVIFGEGKKVSDILSIMDRISRQGENIMITRVDPDKAHDISEKYPAGSYHEISRVLTLMKNKVKIRGRGTILVISAGTSDIPVAEEALADLEKRLQQRSLDYERLTLTAPAAGVVLPPPPREEQQPADPAAELP